MADIVKEIVNLFKNKVFLQGLAAFIIITILLAGTFSMQAGGYGIDKKKNYLLNYDEALAMAMGKSVKKNIQEGMTLKTKTLDTINDHVNENSESEHKVDINIDYLANITIKLTWTDEPPAGIRYTNTPDNLGLKVIAPDGTEKTADPWPNDNNGHGEVTFTMGINPEDALKMKGTWQIIVIAGDCGDQEPIINLFGLRTISDTGNDYTVEVNVGYYE